MPSISFPNEYFLSPNKSIPTATTPTTSKAFCYYHLLHLYYLILKSIGKLSFFFGVWEFATAKKVKLFTEFLTVFLFQSMIAFNWRFELNFTSFSILWSQALIQQKICTTRSPKTWSIFPQNFKIPYQLNWKNVVRYLKIRTNLQSRFWKIRPSFIKIAMLNTIVEIGTEKKLIRKRTWNWTR